MTQQKTPGAGMPTSQGVIACPIHLLFLSARCLLFGPFLRPPGFVTTTVGFACAPRLGGERAALKLATKITIIITTTMATTLAKLVS